ncbi:MAG TPA: tRNA (N6-threonylcarbamoyladenosine(37)-N6)-methyltransferase TrmO [Ohtaekwangia sp.]
MNTTLKFIGRIHSPLKRIEDCPLQESENAPEATLEIFSEFIEGIQSIQPGDSIVLLTWFHQAHRDVITCVSRNNFTGPKFGVFSTRSPDRPNPIGLHYVKVISVTADRISVSALEALDGTPLIDIKPVWKQG